MKDLVSIQSELKAPKGQYNAFGKYKYRNQEDILEAVKPLLKKYNSTLTISDEVKEICGVLITEATAEFTDSDGKVKVVKAQAGIDIARKGMDIAQSFGSSSSYARKYCLNGLFLIDDTKDADATNDHKTTTPVKELLSSDRFEKALKLIEENKYTVKELEEKYNLTDTQKKTLTKFKK